MIQRLIYGTCAQLAVECIFCSACIRFVECCPQEGLTGLFTIHLCCFSAWVVFFLVRLNGWSSLQRSCGQGLKILFLTGWLMLTGKAMDFKLLNMCGYLNYLLCIYEVQKMKWVANIISAILKHQAGTGLILCQLY